MFKLAIMKSMVQVTLYVWKTSQIVFNLDTIFFKTKLRWWPPHISNILVKYIYFFFECLKTIAIIYKTECITVCRKDCWVQVTYLAVGVVEPFMHSRLFVILCFKWWEMNTKWWLVKLKHMCCFRIQPLVNFILPQIHTVAC